MARSASRRWIVATLLLWLLASAAPRAQGATSLYLAQVWRYRAGDHEGAVEALTKLPLRGLRERVRNDLGPLVCRQVDGARSCGDVAATSRGRVHAIWRAALPAALLLHIETSEYFFRVQEPDGVNTHRDIVRDLLARMGELAVGTDARLKELEVWRKDGFLLLVWTMQKQFDFRALEIDLERATRQWPDDPWLLLASGWIEEIKAWPPTLRELYRDRPVQGTVPGGRVAWLRRERGYRLSRAEEKYRASLLHRGDEAETHLRLGRVLMLQGRAEDARASLDRVPGTSSDSSLRYLAALFVAGVHERSNVPAARAAYTEALRVWPGAQSARLGLSRLHALERRHDEARKLLVVPTDVSGRDQPTDPWFWYEYGQAWRLAPALATAQAALRR